MPLSTHSVGTYQETSSHGTRQGTLFHSRLSSLAKRLELVCASWFPLEEKRKKDRKKERKEKWGKKAHTGNDGMIGRISSQKPRMRERASSSNALALSAAVIRYLF